MVLGLVGSVLGTMFQNSAAKKQAQFQAGLNLSQSKNLYDYTSKGDFNTWLKQWNKQTAYQDKYLSNSAKATQNLNQKLMDYQYALERQSRQSSFQDTRKDLESAGYNPLLAVGNQSGYTSVGSGVSADSAQIEQAGLANSAIQGFTQLSNAHDLYRQTSANIDEIKSNILSSGYTNDLHSAQAEYTRSQTVGQDIQNYVDNKTKLDQAIANLDLTKQQKENLKQDVAESQARIIKYSYENQASSAQAELARTQKDLNASEVRFAKRYPEVYTMNKLGILDSLGPFGHGVKSGVFKKLYKISRATRTW